MKKNEIYNTLNKAYFSESKHENKEIENLPELLKDVSYFIDIGASLGQYTYYANKILNNKKIIAVEPDPIRFEELERNCTKWKEESNNQIEARNEALSNYNGTITFYTTESSVSGGLFPHEIKNKNDVKWKPTKVSCIKLDDLYQDRMPDLVKIDVEGSELRVLQGATHIMQKGKTRFLIELHSFIDPKGQKSPQDIYDFFNQYGYIHKKYHSHILFYPQNAQKFNLLRKVKQKLFG